MSLFSVDLRQGRWLIAVLMLNIAAAAHADTEEPFPRIVVTGQGSVDIAPDMAVITLTVVREAATARAALDANSKAMADVLGAMEEQGIAQRDLQTSNFSIRPKYTYPPRNPSGPTEAPRIVGHTVSNSLTVRVRDISKVGEVLDKSVTLGVNQGGNILFTNDDPAAALDRARTAAVHEALAKATTLAQAAGVKRGQGAANLRAVISAQAHANGQGRNGDGR